MSFLRRPVSGVSSVALPLAVCLTATLAAQSPSSSNKPVAAGGQGGAPAFKAKRTVDGHPDISGVWSNNSVTPLERPEAVKDRAMFTDAEFKVLQERATELFNASQAGDLLGDRLVQEILKDPALRPFDPKTGNYNTFWIVGRDFNDRRTSLVTDPPEGRIPALTEQAIRVRRERARPSELPAGPEDVSLSVRCITYGVPSMLTGYNSYFDIRQSAGHVTIAQEMIHDVRVVPLDGRPHLPKNIRLWNGDQRGRWEGDTLVVDTTNYSAAGAIRGATENLHLVERFTRVGPDTLEWSITFDDPATWTKPWTAVMRLTLMKQKTERIYEYACHEGNHALPGILAGARAQEKKAAAKSPASR
jgi:hypothetical protein